MTPDPPRLAFLSRRAYGGTPLQEAVPALQKFVARQEVGELEFGPNILPELLPEVPEELEGSCAGLICRPTWGGHVDLELVNRLRIEGQPFHVATLSSGTSHIASMDGEAEVHNAVSGNTEQTAELTVFLAICLLRRALASMVNMGFGVYLRPDYTRTRSLSEVTWVVVGAGAIGCAVLRKAAALGVPTLRAFDTRFAGRDPSEISEEKELDDLKVEFVDELDRALHGADVVTLHVPSNESTIRMVDEEWFRLLPNKAVMVNCARHEVIDETALHDALDVGQIQGYASDVLPTKAERRAANPYRPDVGLWRRACWSMIGSIDRCTHGPSRFSDAFLAQMFMPVAQGGERNMVYTPHIGGSTADAEQAVAKEALDKLIEKLGLLP
jgi:phosphoglycerate dehydrogenase-like enzyme